MDPRELILVRLHAILSAIEGIQLSLRNDIEVPEDKTPAAVLLDGDEMTDEAGFGRGRSAAAPLIMRMTPEVYVVTQEDPTVVGTSLSAFRAKIVRAICTDPTLTKLAHNGDIRYNGMQTGLALGRSIQGEMGMMFEIAYVLYPGQVGPAPSTETETES